MARARAAPKSAIPNALSSVTNVNGSVVFSLERRRTVFSMSTHTVFTLYQALSYESYQIQRLSMINEEIYASYLLGHTVHTHTHEKAQTKSMHRDGCFLCCVL